MEQSIKPRMPSATIAIRPATSAVPVLVFVALAGTMSMMSFTAVIGPVARLLGMAEWHVGLALTASGALWTLSARRWGRRSDRVGRKRVLLTALAGYAAVYLLMAVFVDLALRSPPLLLVSVLALVGTRAVEGLFYAAVPSTAAALVADETPPAGRAGVMARLGAANAVGLVVGPALAGWIAFHDLALALYAALALPVLSWLVVWLKLPGPPPTPPPVRERGQPAPAWRDPRLRLPLFAAFASILAVTISQVIVGFFAIDRLHLAPAAGAKVAGLTLAALGVGLMGSQALVMRCRSVPPARWIAMGALIAAGGFGSMVLVAQQWQLLAAYAVGAFGMGFVMPAFPALAANAVAAHEQGATQGAVASVQGMGMVLGPMLGTLLYAWSPDAPYLLLALVLAALALAARNHHLPSRTPAQ